jgi:dGTPase
LSKVAGGYARHPLSFLVEAADDVCYGFLDLEDAVEMGILDLHDVADTLLRALPAAERDQYRPRSDQHSHRVVFAKLRGKIFREAIAAAVRAFFRHYDAILQGSFELELLEDAAARGQRAAQVVREAKQRAKEEVFPYDHKANVELASYAITGRLLDEFVRASMVFSEAYARSPANPRVDSKTETLMNMLGDHRPNKRNAPAGADWTPYQCARRMIDFISGMTDDFAIRVSRQLSGQVELRT